MPALTRSALRPLIQRALQEDIGRGDLTSRALFSPTQQLHAVVIAKQPGIVAGAQIAAWTFQALDRRIHCAVATGDGQPVRTGQTILRLDGPARSVLAAERTALNFLGHLSGIATLTHRYVRQVRPHRAAILDTRKTLPGLRWLEKYAVAIGGGANHRMRLDDAVLIKTPHLRAAGLSVESAVQRAKQSASNRFIEIEVRTVAELNAALRTRPHAILLDNWRLPAIRRAVALRRGARPLLEISGGVTLQNVRRLAATGVERISIGRLTHSAPALDVALRVT